MSSYLLAATPESCCIANAPRRLQQHARNRVATVPLGISFPSFPAPLTLLLFPNSRTIIRSLVCRPMTFVVRFVWAIVNVFQLSS